MGHCTLDADFGRALHASQVTNENKKGVPTVQNYYKGALLYFIGSLAGGYWLPAFLPHLLN
jgi:hypothetical protein